MKKAFYAGSFDPFTNGHLYVVKQAAEIFQEVIIGIGENEQKRERNFSSSAMKLAIEEVLKRENLTDKVKVEIYQGLTVTKAREYQVDFLIRGLRNGVDYGYEENMALVNRNISNLETIYFRAGETAHVSASVVVELFVGGADISHLVPPEILHLMKQT